MDGRQERSEDVITQAAAIDAFDKAGKTSDKLCKVAVEHEGRRSVAKCRTISEVKAIVGDDFIVSDLIEIEKSKFDPRSKTYSTRIRTVMNLKSSLISAMTSLTFKVELPRANDAIKNMIFLMDELEDDEILEQLVVDVADAFLASPEPSVGAAVFRRKVRRCTFSVSAERPGQQKRYAHLVHCCCACW